VILFIEGKRPGQSIYGSGKILQSYLFERRWWSCHRTAFRDLAPETRSVLEFPLGVWGHQEGPVPFNRCVNVILPIFLSEHEEKKNYVGDHAVLFAISQGRGFVLKFGPDRGWNRPLLMVFPNLRWNQRDR